MPWNGAVRNRERTWLELVLEAEPEFYAKRRNETLFEFSNGRKFIGDPTRYNTAYLPLVEPPD
jgi:hypothetical protein